MSDDVAWFVLVLRPVLIVLLLTLIGLLLCRNSG